MEFIDLAPSAHARGAVQLPGSKSISNRTLLLAALAQGETQIRDLLKSDDTDRMLEALTSLGVTLTRTGENDYHLVGTGGSFPHKEADLFLGNAGTAFRPLTAALAFSGGTYKLHGVPRMHERPIGDLVDALRQVGADITYLGQEGFPPLLIKPAHIAAQGSIKIRGDVSSQFLTALLMALPMTGKETHIELVSELISKPYIEITLRLMAQFGVEVQRDGWERFTVPAASGYVSPGTVYVEGDASSASYFLAAGALGGGPVRVQGVGAKSIQGDVAFADALEAIGVTITKGDNWIEASAPQLPLKAFNRDFNHIPDAAMTLAVVALFCDGPSRLTNIASWRVKETDRIAAMATELRKLGAIVEEGEDWLQVTPVPTLNAQVPIDTYDDHRMAMCFSLATFGGVPVRINDPQCTAKTFPTYFDVFSQVVS
ncbi:3-phosphoshikimate 1-carboxyvinyltransferase [Cellvibrio japonicus]|uniref:3-phosphoshikimate 1-carboxyvinyltransferase n=1 Tax=Cellvibrio japonicus (strain Ueda107) TaxID=498211 RepID=AROA_CELJU|nr:3-phosphoshikimate 1-carboxyvinyltransferase [Cellvibrio japonicus]B3PJM0.1 RecName: Full=3-phosphoshikimate 1-carboxyvinyltransferase; AltName: Full=5-enolpyruvylshikimate-3-phosphate synthase; Short=EPSP synthase; Short=EPSPS [Cellvibrio japonicus Ueda107]ACE85131.1 3-phosphoshikimate 1-carboxyvinyltransferase [Cellvibrio japonicus Ueda107]QEI11303.1 3-phosphoshikimate 1-carboxyvinyltransferase [Cellvibrio japonicus]QEI14877.1 3-phosphoshikimate 1-carboxyvinyltransferase [Cellvibrio japoni